MNRKALAFAAAAASAACHELGQPVDYTHDKTQQTGKTTVLSPSSSRTQTFAYNLKGLLSEVTASTTSGSTTSVASKTIYGYYSGWCHPPNRRR